MKELSNNTIERISKIFGYLEALKQKEIGFVSSKDLAQGIGTTEYTVRKDLSILGVTGHSRRGYDVKLLEEQLGEKLHLSKKRKACIVGLGRLGTAILDYEKFKVDGFEIVAGFDCSINKLERIRTQIDVFGINDLERIIKERQIELGIITVPQEAAQEIANRLCSSGVKGILNFSPVKVNVPGHIIYLDMDFTSALRFIAARLESDKGTPPSG